MLILGFACISFNLDTVFVVYVYAMLSSLVNAMHVEQFQFADVLTQKCTQMKFIKLNGQRK